MDSPCPVGEGVAHRDHEVSPLTYRPPVPPPEPASRGKRYQREPTLATNHHCSPTGRPTSPVSTRPSSRNSTLEASPHDVSTGYATLALCTRFCVNL